MIKAVFTEKKAKNSSFIKSLILRIWIVFFVITLILILYPAGLGIIRYFLLLMLPLLCISGALILMDYKQKIFSFLMFFLLFLFCAFMMIPGRNYSVSDLRESYLLSLSSYEGTNYVWGGENFLGIDCSGLVRKALINANIKTGILTFNPELLREAFYIWWNDCSAKSLKKKYKGLTVFLFKAANINSIEEAGILPGDIAVTSDGAHVLAYLGNKTWIEADPGFLKVIKVKVPSDNSWFGMPVDVMRWRQLK